MGQGQERTGVLMAVGAVLGAALGYLGARVVLVGSGLSLVPWALVGLALGACAESRRSAAGTGALFGFVLAFTFMTTGYDGVAPLGTRLAPFALLGLVGALCGAVLGAVGRVATARVRR